LSLVPKLKYEHVYLTSYSKMRVDLPAQVSKLHQTPHSYITSTCVQSIHAVHAMWCTVGLHSCSLFACASQVLSNSVVKALLLSVGFKANETAHFAEMFDKFFDCLNCSSLSAGKQSRNPFRSPYRSGADWKLKVHTCTSMLT